MSGPRVAVVGATGALGTEVLIALDESGPSLAELLPIASDRSLGVEVDFQGASYPVVTEAVDLDATDLVLLCAPAAISLEWAAKAARAGIPAIDLSGALAGRDDVPLALDPEPGQARAPLLAVPPGPALAWIRVLAPLAQGLGIERVLGTALVSAGGVGRRGIDALQAETVALLAQEDAPETDLAHPLAFDLVPWSGALEPGGGTARERELAATVARALGGGVRVAVSWVCVPTFCGDAATLAIEMSRHAEPEAAAELLRKANDVELVLGELPPTTRAAAGADRVLVGRLRRDPSCERGLLLWLAADSTRLAALHAARLAQACLGSP
jgi:aspartate-semialdehyde dehydrogenase